MLRARRVRAPQPAGKLEEIDHSALRPCLELLADQGIGGLAEHTEGLRRYIDHLAGRDPDQLDHEGALAFWINLYNAGAVMRAAQAFRLGQPSVLRMEGSFDRPLVRVTGEQLSLDDIEHGKIRRFRDPRIHGALVCGSASCPTLRPEPFSGPRLHRELDDRLRLFLEAGAYRRREGTVLLSRVFLWYGADFVRPDRMPTLLPAPRRRVLRALLPWLDHDERAWVRGSRPSVEYQPYDWSLRCAVA